MQINGKKLSNHNIPVVRITAGKNCCRARNNDEEAINNAKHIRHKCRASLLVAGTAPRQSIRRSPVAPINATDPRKMYWPADSPCFGALPSPAASIIAADPTPSAARNVPQS